ncbi:2,3,4,5-tetrahydropyridine-2,6-dicarboxylate N-succinyltransferase [Kitasatospora aureofaciens]|uniref:2,3,4,5-tetrahydropyridine-2,6-dicarboxylate N-succinyltransferase n=1 Tax=Kitasatospora aureofaciens TaxID=1894 RepID=UPI001C479B42|nr:2,3,4,5-tetrahydropyridine-2,6-dicarboxylate N-succinyltransferase [Kitasatospora aureofaciens]MBV6700329.1 2,3,4,5-tetrahydropyridine-2,6-dicarboxylate N-succinyltransferase [Kitasatospora aureofaciens]
MRSELEDLWERRDEVSLQSAEAVAAVDAAIDLLDTGRARVAELVEGEVVVHDWLKNAILLLYKQASPQTSQFGPFQCADKIPLKTGIDGSGVQVSPGAVIRRGSYQEPGAVVMPSHIGIGSYVGEGTLVDSWVGIGSCAQIGRNVHLSGGVGLGGMIEPPMARPVVIEDDAFIGARSMIYSGARVGEGALLGAGALLTDTIPVIDAATGEELGRGEVPPWTVAVPASRPREFAGGTFGLPCLLVIKHLKKGERHDKAKLNDAVRTQPPVIL